MLLQDHVTQLGFNTTTSTCPNGIVRALDIRVWQSELKSMFFHLTTGVLLERFPNLSKLQLPFAILSQSKLSFLFIIVLIIQVGIWRQLTEPERTYTLG